MHGIFNVKCPAPEFLLEFNGRVSVLEIPPDQAGVQTDPAAVMQGLRQSGLVLLRNFEAGLEDFEAFTRRFCSLFHHTASRSAYRHGEGDGYTTWTPPQNFSLPSHSEGTFRPFKPPDIGFFHCITPPSQQGGETMLVDGREFYRRLPTGLAEYFMQHGIIYESRWERQRWQVEFDIGEPGEMLKLAPQLPGLEYQFEGDEMIVRCHRAAIQELPDGECIFVNALLGHLPRVTHPGYAGAAVFCKPSNRVFFGDGEAIPDRVINLLLDIQDEICLDYRWRHNDLLIIDNNLFMHGKRSTAAECERLIAVRFGHLQPEFSAGHQPVSEALP